MKKENKYKDLYAGFIIAIATFIITPLIIKLWQITLYQPINENIVNEVQEIYEEEEKEIKKNLKKWLTMVYIDGIMYLQDKERGKVYG